MRIKKGRSKIGTTPTSVVKSLKCKNISVCCAMSKRGFIYKEINQKPYNGESFLGYIGNFFEFINSMNIGPCLVVMDNVPFHKCNSVKEKFIEMGHEIFHLPPYSPFLNPIENLFSKWKDFVKRSNCMCESQLMCSMEEGLNTITNEDCEAWYRNMKGYTRLFQNETVILD